MNPQGMPATLHRSLVYFSFTFYNPKKTSARTLKRPFLLGKRPFCAPRALRQMDGKSCRETTARARPAEARIGGVREMHRLRTLRATDATRMVAWCWLRRTEHPK